MKIIVVLLALVVLACAAAEPIRRDHRVLVNRPTLGEIFHPRVPRVRRSDQPGVKGRPFIEAITPLPDFPVRKGEYVCGNKICKLRPGEIPKGCIGCQYPIH